MKRIAGLLTVLLSLAATGNAMAQGKSCDPATIFRAGLNWQLFLANIKLCAADDVKAALDLATASGDLQAQACFKPLLASVQHNTDGGIFLKLQTYRELRKSGVLGTCAQWLNSTIAPITF